MGHIRQDLTLRYWHPGFWLAVALGLVRYAGILRNLCKTCGGAGRVMTGAFGRRRMCPTCAGTGKDRDDNWWPWWPRRSTAAVSGLSTRKSVQDSIAASPAGNHELYAKGSIVICVSCAAPLYRLERGIYIGERAGRSADAYRPVRVQDLVELRAREDIDAGVRTVLLAQSPAQLAAHCDRIPELRTGMPLACPICTRAFVAMRSSGNPAEASETIDRGYVIELVTIGPPGTHNARSLGSAKRAREIAGIRR